MALTPLQRFIAAILAVAVFVYATVCGLLYTSQDAFLYFPVGRGADVPSQVLRRGDATVIVSTNGVSSARAVLYFGGNAEDVSRSIVLLNQAFPRTAIFAMHYRGYGGSSGTPSERVLVGDATALYDRISPTHGAVTLVGRSLGSGIAAQLAAKRRVDRLVLVTPYNSILELASERFRLFPVRWILRDKYETWRHAGKIHAPVTFIIAGNDQVIPTAGAFRLVQAFPAATRRVVVIPGAGHDNISDSAVYLAALRGN